MKVPVLRKTLTRHAALFGRNAVCLLITVMFLWTKSVPLLAEGSKDFVNYPGYRLFLDTRDANQQQMKVFAFGGETINVGASHVGIQGGYIKVYSPGGTLMATFDNTGASTGQAIISNDTQEANGPIGIPNGYNPGIINVPADSAGVWTVIFDYPTYVDTPFPNILNGVSWTLANQPNTPRVVLAWDITVTTGPATANNQLTGRVFTNEYVSVLQGNGVTTSPKFYVLTQDGYLYRVNIMNADPFRFPISSNSLGLVNNEFNPLYISDEEANISRNANPLAWLPGQAYLYEPQAEDFGELINNKIFFNIPDPNLPALARTTDVYRSNPHTTWLYTGLQAPEISNYFALGFNPGGLPCGPNIIEFGKGANFFFETNDGGSITLQLDLDNNGNFDDPIDVQIVQTLSEGLDSVYWNGIDGLGNVIAVQDSFRFNYQATIRFGEIHIALSDVENNLGGVTFDSINAITGPAPIEFLYDHTLANGPVSGGGTAGNPLPTLDPFMYGPGLPYGNDWGNIKYLDQWSFVDREITSTPIVVQVVPECDCVTTTPELTAGDDDVTVCAGTDLVMTASNSNSLSEDLDYNWTGPLNFLFNETVGALDVSTATIADATILRAGTYTVIATNQYMCADTIDINVSVDPTPVVDALLGGGSYCAGESLTLTALNLTLGIDSLFYTITGPSNTYTGVVLGGLTAISVTIDPLTEAEEGTYTLVLTTENGCVSEPISANVIVNATPVLAEVSGSGSYCEGDNVTLVVENTAAGIGAMTCTVTGPNGFFSQNQVAAGAQLEINLTNITVQLEGNYNFTCTFNGCTSEVLSLNVDVELTPEINGISPNDDFCIGDDVNFDAENVVPNTGPLTYIWIGPNGDTLFVGMNAPELGPFPYTLQNVQASDAGLYTLILITSAGCESVPQTVEIGVLPTPEICSVTGGGDACVGQTVTLSAMNCAVGTGSIQYVWQDPQGNQISSGTLNNNGPFEAVLTNIQLTDSGNYTLTLTSVGSGCSDVEIVNLNVLQGLNVIDITPDSSYCEGTNVTLTATTTVNSGQITYTWTGPNGFNVTETVSAPGPLTTIITSISVSDTGTYILNVTSDAGCEAGPFEVFVGLNPTFNITNITGGGSYCLENVDDIILTGTGSGTADSVTCVWVDPNGVILSSGTVATTDPFTVSPSDTVSGTYTLICTTVEGCSDTASVDVEIIEMPITNILNDDTITLCELDTLLLCGQNLNPNIGTFDYIWTTPSGTTITGQGNGTATFCDELLPIATFGEGLYTLVISYQGCVSVDSVYVTLNPNPVISQIFGGGTYCQGDTVVLQFWNTNPAVDSVYHTCIIGNTSVTGFIGGGDTVTIFVTEPGFICCSLESFDGCVSSLACTEVIFEEAPDIEITTNSPVCANETLTLNGTNNATCTGDVTYTWTGPNGFMFTGTAPCGGPFPASVPNPTAGEYCLIVSNGNCADTACVDVEVLEIPFVEGGLVNGGGDYCQGTDATLSATIVNPSGGDINYVWTKDGTPINSGTAPSGTILTLDLPGLELADGGEYCLELTCVTTGCQSDGDDCATVNVLQAVQNLEATGGGDYCEGLNVPLNGTSDPGPGNVTYTWTGPGFNFSSTAPNGGPYPATVTAITVSQSGVYVLVVETADGCIDSASVVVNVNPMPLITNVSGGGEYCEGETATLTFTIDPNGANSVDWTVTCPGSDTSGTVTTVTTITIDILVTAANAGQCTITATSDAGCEAEPASQTITIIEVQDPVLTATPSVLCPGEKLTLTTTAQSGTSVSYEWFRDDVSIGVTPDPMLMVDPGVAGEYTVLVTVDGCGSGVSNPVTVTVISDPDAVDDTNSTNAGEPVSGNVLGNDSPQTGVTVTVVEGPTNGTVTVDANGNYTYTPDEGFAGATDQFTYEICLTDCPDACDEAIVTITVNLVECNIPNVITPNGDGVNEVLFIDCAPFRENNRLRIFNRWGDEIAVFEPYNNEWDGTYGDDKKDVPASTYFYLFEEDKTSGNEPKAGYIKVLR